MKSTLADARLSAESNLATYVDNVERNVFSASVSVFGCAATIHDGHGVGTEPIWLTFLVRSLEKQISMVTYETTFFGICKGFRGEPLPHERACRTIINGIDEPSDVVIN